MNCWLQIATRKYYFLTPRGITTNKMHGGNWRDICRPKAEGASDQRICDTNSFRYHDGLEAVHFRFYLGNMDASARYLGEGICIRLLQPC